MIKKCKVYENDYYYTIWRMNEKEENNTYYSYPFINYIWIQMFEKQVDNAK